MLVYAFGFSYDRRGFGDLTLMRVEHQDVIESSTELWRGAARTGSIDKTGKLVNALPVENWMGMEPPVKTTERAMWIDKPENGWKYRLYRNVKGVWTWTRYLIHPDGNLPGTEGCIGILGQNALELYEMLMSIHTEVDSVMLYVNPFSGRGV
jgi:hypothetical protein